MEYIPARIDVSPQPFIREIEQQSSSRAFIEANTLTATVDEVRHQHLIPVFVKDNEPLEIEKMKSEISDSLLFSKIKPLIDTRERVASVRRLVSIWSETAPSAYLSRKALRMIKSMPSSPRRTFSCTNSSLNATIATGDLNFHWRCLMAPLTILDYSIVHEMAHLKFDNHSDAFWNEVDKIIPDHRERKTWLRFNNAGMDL